MSSGLEIVEWRPVRKNSLRGFVTVRINNLVIHDCHVHMKNGGKWVAMPSRARLDHDGNQMVDRNGKTMWLPIVSWRSRDASNKFSAAVLAALTELYPDALDGADDDRQ